MGRGKRYWHAPEEKKNKVKRPPGLKGKEIGLFYRNLRKKELVEGTIPPVSNREFTLNLVIPPKVIMQVRSHLNSINRIAKRENIDIKYVSRIRNNIETIEIEDSPHIKEENNDVLIKSELVDEDFEMATNSNIKQVLQEFIPLFKKTQQSFFDDRPGPSKFLQSKVEIKQEEEFDNGEIVQMHKKPWSQETVPDIHSIPLIKVVPKEVTPFKANEDFISLKVNEPKASTKLVTEESTSQQSKSNFVPFNLQPGISSAAEFIPVEKESHKSGISQKLLSLRDVGDFKYSYNDIITGTFNDKLDECLAKGIKINIANTEEIIELNETLYEEYKVMVKKEKYKKMMVFREKLPTYKKSDHLLNVINSNQVVVISGETGCGKSTQVPQIILDDAILNKRGANIKIFVTQPRRIAASSLAKRVADERAERLGNSVGYAVRLERVEARTRGSITFMTTGILLNELEINQGLTNISHLILDEVHERDVHVDLSMVTLKEILKKRKDLKVILMSATLDADRLSAYFNKCPVVHIEGLAYPVQDVYLEQILEMTGFQFDEDTSNARKNQRGRFNRQSEGEKKKMEKEIKHRADISPWLETIKRKITRDVYKTLLDYRVEDINIDLIVHLLAHICKGDAGGILVFLPGIQDITNLLKEIELSRRFTPSSRYEIYPLHSKLSSVQQRAIFERPPDGVRKIIIATNIAETSITIDDIVYVVDCGKIKLSGLNVEENISTLSVEWISQANLRQRRGRAGRCQPGVCYHLMTSHRASRLAERILPELQRSNLLEPVLMFKKLRLGKAEEAMKMVPDPPAESTVKWAVKHLQQCGALDDKETLTPLGWHLARLPVHPAAGKLLLLGALFGCLDRAASIAAVWGFKDPYMLVIGKEKESDQAKRELAIGEPSDHVAISQAIIMWERAGRDKRTFAYEYFLSHNTLQLLSEMKQQLGDHLRQMGFLASGDIHSSWENRNGDNLSLFKAIVAASLYPNVANVKWNGLHSRNPRRTVTISARTPEEGRVEIHPSSVMTPCFDQRREKVQLCNNPGANWLVYWLKQKSTKLYLIEVTLVYTLPLLFFGELAVSYVEDNPDDCYISISTIRVRCHKNTADLLFELRSLLDHVLASKVMASSDNATRHSEFEEQVLNAVMELITAEDEQADYIDDDNFSETESSDRESYQRNWRN